MSLPIINAIWIGKRMGPAHAACLKSFIATDHIVTLHAYGEVSDAPRGVRYADANSLLAEEKLLRYPNGSYAISSNLMRYELLRQGLGLYVDCDVFCLRPIEDADNIYGWETSIRLNNAVLKLAPDSPILADLCAIDEGWTPPWKELPPGQPPVPLNELPWGSTGPIALTYFAKKHGLEQAAQPSDVFYPLTHHRWTMLYDADLRIEDLTTRRTRYFHLYNEGARRTKPQVPATSPLGRMIARANGGLLGRVRRAVRRRLGGTRRAT